MQYNIKHSLHPGRGEMSNTKKYFKCTTRDGRTHFFDQKCNRLDAWKGRMLDFIEEDEESGELNTLALIPIDFVAIVEIKDCVEN